MSVRGACPCSVNKTCVDPNQSCNCDVKENKWNSDEGYYQEPHSLGITNMYFLQQKDLDDEAQGRITLGPLECVETSELATRPHSKQLTKIASHRYPKVCGHLYHIAVVH